MSLMLVSSILTEAPSFQFQSALLARVPVGAVVQASMLLLALRLSLYAVLPRAGTPWAVLPIELLHGVTFATSWGAGIVGCKRLAPPHLNTTMQSVFSALYGGVGSGLGAIAGGALYGRLGAPRMFACAAATVLGGWALAAAIDGAVTFAKQRGGIGGGGGGGDAGGGGGAVDGGDRRCRGPDIGRRRLAAAAVDGELCVLRAVFIPLSCVSLCPIFKFLLSKALPIPFLHSLFFGGSYRLAAVTGKPPLAAEPRHTTPSTRGMSGMIAVCFTAPSLRRPLLTGQKRATVSKRSMR